VMSILKTQEGSTCDAEFCVFFFWCVCVCMYVFSGFVLLSLFPNSDCWAACFLLVCARDICSRRMSSKKFFVCGFVFCCYIVIFLLTHMEVPIYYETG